MSGNLFTYTPDENPRLEREQLSDKPFLRFDHYARLSRSERGVLRDLTIATANLYSTYNPNEILDIYTDSDNSKKDNYGCISMAKRIAHTGAMVIPYPEYKNENLGDRNWRRMRTDFISGKYLSPLGQYSPPYRVLGMDHPDYVELFKDQIIKECLEELEIKDSDKEQTTIKAKEILEKNDYDKVKHSYKNPDVPIIVVEGEFKALAIFDAWLDSHKDCIKHVLQSSDPDFALLEIDKPPLFTCAGIGGVWNMVRKGPPVAGKPTKYVVRPEWEKNIELKNRNLLICFDSDSKWITQVGHAASCLAQSCSDFNCKVSYISIPSPKGLKYGADDFIQAKGYKEFLDLIPLSEPIAAGIPYNQIVNATKDGTPPIDYLIHLEKDLKKKANKQIER